MFNRLYVPLLACLFLASAGCSLIPTSTQRDVLDPMPERVGEVTLRGVPVTLLGNRIKQGDHARDITLVANDMSEVNIEAYRGKIMVVSVVPSIDTGVCAQQTRTFNETAAALGDNVVILTVSMDLPMAQKRFCASEGIDQVVMLSDYRYWELGLKWGLRIKESGLLARSLFVVDENGAIWHAQIVPELTKEPDYDQAMKVLQYLIDVKARDRQNVGDLGL